MEERLKLLFEKLYSIGENEEGRGVTRLGYSSVEDDMHRTVSEYMENEGFITATDEVGNTFIMEEDWDDSYLIASHLDSVIEGGRYDGVLGVLIGLAILLEFKKNKIKFPLKVGIFRNEESSRFMSAMIGSKLITGKMSPEDFNRFVDRDGIFLSEIFEERGYNPEPEKISGIKALFEVHIEQARVLEDEGLSIGIVDTIAGNNRMEISLEGMAEHSGATPMNIRSDSLAAAAEIISFVESVGQTETETSVATVGYIENTPNSMNVIPGATKFSVDIRDIHTESMVSMKAEIKEKVKEVASERNIKAQIKDYELSEAVNLSAELADDLENFAEEHEIKYKRMVSGAGHDSMHFADITETSLLFIPCKDGISHNPKEEIDIEDAEAAAAFLYQYLLSLK